MNYEVGDQVFIRIRPIKSTIRFGKRTMLSPWFIRPLKILERIRHVAYHLALPPQLHTTHNVFHAVVLRHYIANEPHTIQWKELHVSNEGTIMVKPLRILDHRVRQLKHCLVDQVNVQWDTYIPRFATWEDAKTMH